MITKPLRLSLQNQDFSKINKKKLVKEYNKNLPYIVKIGLFKNGTTNVDADTKEMETQGYSINFSEKGKDFYPIKKVKGFENNDKTIVLLVDLTPNKAYEFVISNRSFKSKDGFPLKSDAFPIKFKTKVPHPAPRI